MVTNLTPQNGDHLAVSVQGPSIVASLNGATVAATNDATFATALAHGVGAGDGGGAAPLFDDFSYSPSVATGLLQLTAIWGTHRTWPGYAVPLTVTVTDGAGHPVAYSGTFQLTSAAINNGAPFVTDIWSGISSRTYTATFATTDPPITPTATVTEQANPAFTTTTDAVTVDWEPCTGPAQNFVGAESQSPTYGGQSGASADINAVDIPLCGNPAGSISSDSSVWVMESAGTYEYAQVGYARNRFEGEGQTPVYFFEYNNNFPTPTERVITIAGSQLASGTHHYSVEYNFTTHALDMKIDGVAYGSTNFDPDAEWLSVGSPDWAGETHDNGDNIAGTLATPVSFANLQVRGPNSGDGWSAPSSASLYGNQPSPARYHTAWDTLNSAFHMWTQDN